MKPSSKRKLGRTLRRRLDIAATLAMIGTCVILVWAVLSGRAERSTRLAQARGRPDIPVPSAPVSLEGSSRKGSATAPVALLQFSEFQCPFCQRFATETLPALTRKYVSTGRVLLAFRHLPLVELHPLAMTAAQITACPALSADFWTLHDSFFALPKITTRLEYERRSTDATGIKAVDVATCLEDSRSMEIVEADITLARSLQVQSTPTFLLGENVDGMIRVSRIIVGAKPKEEFEQVIDGLLNSLGQR